MNRLSLSILFLFLAGATCFGQSSYKGLTPGKSTRAEVERVLGQPVNKVSEIVIEYAPQTVSHWPIKAMKLNSGPIFVQYDKETAVVERMELLCGSSCQRLIGSDDSRSSNRGAPSPEAVIFKERGTDKEKILVFYGDPFFVVVTHNNLAVRAWQSEVSLGFYEPGFFESQMPKGCNAGFAGQWETDLGRMAIRKLAGNKYDGTYANNNGTFTGFVELGLNEKTMKKELYLSAEWKEATGTGTMRLYLHPEMEFNKRGKHTSGRPATFSGERSRVTGQEPRQGEITGRCLY